MLYRTSVTFAAIVLILAFVPASGQNKMLPIPFGIDKRPAKARSDEDLNVTYKSGSDSVFFGFSIPDTPADAYEAVKVTREEAIASKVNIKGEQYVIGKDPSYFKVADFMSWTRGRYFFYAKASSPAALEKFMRAFPF